MCGAFLSDVASVTARAVIVSAEQTAVVCAAARAREFRFQFLDATILFLQRRLHVGRLEAQRDVLGAIGVPRRNIE